MDAAGSRQEDPVPAATPADSRNPEVVETYGRIACPVCGFPIGAVKGSKAAICGNCGFKDGCC